MKPRPIAWFLGKDGEPIFAEGSYTIRIEDEAAGEFVVIESDVSGKRQSLGIDTADWPALRDAIDVAVKACCKEVGE